MVDARNQIRISMSRVKSGLAVTTQLHPDVEETMKFLGQGKLVDARGHGRAWLGTAPILCYDNTSQQGALVCKDGLPYRLDRIGQDIYVPNSYVNLSFLRLVGTSEEGGRTIRLATVISDEELRTLSGLLKKASLAFYNKFLKPINVTICLTTQEDGNG